MIARIWVLTLLWAMETFSAKIYLHLGAHKTGSTFLQAGLEENRDTLAAQGIGYLSQKNIRESKDFNLELAVGEKLRMHSTLVISNELFLGMLPFKEGNPLFYPDAEKTLQALKAQLPLDATIIPIIYIREVASCLESHYFQTFNDAPWLPLQTQDQFRSQIRNLKVSWRNLIERVQAVFPENKPMVRRFESLHTRGEEFYLKNFVQMVGGDQNKVVLSPKTGSKTNRSLSEAGVLVLEKTLHLLAPTQKQEMVKLLKQTLNNNAYDADSVGKLRQAFPELEGLESIAREALTCYPQATKVKVFSKEEVDAYTDLYREEILGVIRTYGLLSPQVLHVEKLPAPPLHDLDWSMIDDPYDPRDVSPLLKNRIDDYLKFRTARKNSGDDVEVLRDALKQQTFFYSDYQNLAKTIEEPFTRPDGISFVCVTHRPWDLPNILKNFGRQKFLKKELILVLNGKGYDLNAVERAVAQSPLNTLISIENGQRRQKLGPCLNVGAAKARYNIVSKLDGDDLYGADYAEDILDPFYWSRAQLSGKRIMAVYWEKTNWVTFLGAAGEPDPLKALLPIITIKQTSPLRRVSGATITISQELLRAMPFRDQSLGEDDQLFRDSILRNVQMASADSFNLLIMRSVAENKMHTWAATRSEWVTPNIYTQIYGERRVNGLFNLN